MAGNGIKEREGIDENKICDWWLDSGCQFVREIVSAKEVFS